MSADNGSSEMGLTAPGDPAVDTRKANSTDSTVSPADPIGTGSEAQTLMDGAPGGDVSAPPSLENLSRGESMQLQFPSLAGQPNVEVAERSADVGKAASKVHRKVFVVFHGSDVFDEKLFNHAPNINATRQYMLDNGLRPLGDVSYAGANRVDEMNVSLSYDVEALPAAVAVDPSVAHVIVGQD